MEAAGATEVQISTLEEALEVLRAGARHRMTAPTLMHEASSRSHSIFMLRLEQVGAVNEWVDGRPSSACLFFSVAMAGLRTHFLAVSLGMFTES